MSLPHFHRKVFLAAVLVHLITAWFSKGYHSADEHFQIVAFAQWKLGELPAEHLPWEFEERIRSSIQPWIATGVFRMASALGADDPFSKAFLLRLLTALLSLITVRAFVNAMLVSVQETLKRTFILLSYFLWFLPFLHVRFAGEAWASICLLQGLIVLHRSDQNASWPWLTGVWFTLVACLRPGLLPAVAGIALWMLVIRKPKLVVIGKAVLASSIVLLLTYGLDTLFYDRSTFSFGLYLDANFPSHPGHGFDAFPWWYYAPWIVKYCIPPIGASMLVCFVLFVRHHPRSAITWCTVPLLIVLSIVPHKELRFLYGIADLVPLVVAVGLGSILHLFSGSWMRIAAWFVGATIVAANMLGLVMVMTRPAGEGRVVIAEELFRSAPPGIRIGYLIDPPEAWRITMPAFYHPPESEEVIIDPMKPDLAGGLDFIVAHPGEAPAAADQLDMSLDELERTEPPWADQLMRWYTWDEGPVPWALYRVKGKPR